MTHPIAMHDQILSYLRNDAISTRVDGSSSFEVIGREFEAYWRAIIGQEVRAKHFPHDSTVPPAILMTIWGLDD